jgi:hypothetical protein
MCAAGWCSCSARAWSPSGGALHWRGFAGRLARTEPILCTVVPEQEGKRMARRRLEQASEPLWLHLPTFRLTADSLPRLLSISY